jgi:hypothetical protein
MRITNANPRRIRGFQFKPMQGRLQMIDKVYIIVISGVETYWIKHVCNSEERARERFKELKISMLQEILSDIMFEINEYVTNEGIYKEIDIAERERWVQFNMKDSDEKIKRIAGCTFEKASTSIHDKPVCDVYILDS